MAEKSGVAPMLETIMPRSSGATTWRTSASTLATSFSVTERRVPVGAFRLITNWPGVGAREEGEPEQGKESQADDEDDAEDDQCERRAAQDAAYKLVVNAEKAFEAVVEPDVEAAGRATGAAGARPLRALRTACHDAQEP